MAEMIPASSPAGPEKTKIFEILKHGELPQSENWRILHSIIVPPNSRVIDFVILIPNQLCIICIVVDLSTSSDLHRFEGTSGRDLDLAKNITEDLRSAYNRTHFRDNSPLSLGYAVVSPDPDSGELRIIIPDPDRDIISESLDNLETSLERYAGTLNPKLWEDLDKLYPEIDWDEWNKFWAEAQEELLVKLRSDLEKLQLGSKGSRISNPTTIHHYDPKTLRSQLLVLTEEQVRSYEEFLKEPRCVIDGAAGTGKTVLAMSLAKQRCEKGETVGMLCSNRYLSDNFEKWAAAVSNNSKGRIIVGTPATLPGKIFEENSIFFEEEHKLRREKWPQLEKTLKFGFLNDGWDRFIEETVNDLRRVIDDTDPDPKKRGIFDYLIVDEAQNLCDEVFLKLMDILLKQGLAEGRWSMFGDFVYQNIVIFDRNVPDVLEVLKNFGEGLDWEYEQLKTNCRNTQQISDAVDKLVPVESVPRSGVHGPHVQIKFFDSLDELNKMLGDLISIYHNKGRQSKECILLSSGADEVFKDTVEKYGGEYSGWKLLPFREGTEDNSSEGDILRYSDVYDYQGLESNLVILVMPKPKTGEQVELSGGDIILTRTRHLMRVLYTGMSRAHTMLIILAEENSYRESFQASWPDYDWTEP